MLRVLRVLRERGWIESQQGKGRFVRGRPAMAAVEPNRPGHEQITSRMPTLQEAKQLALPRSVPLLAVFGDRRRGRHMWQAAMPPYGLT
ncbi:hypothetical protein ACWEPC_00935 [Nonomuraea sp. NPDC004297]